MRRETSILLGAALALAASATIVGTQLVSGADSSDETVFVPITPCRLIDTRPNPDVNTGPRSSKIGANETAVFGAWDGTDSTSTCEIPNTATAIATNAVAIAPSARSFMTLFPGDVDNPGTANLNYVADQAPTPNAVNIPLSATGSFNVFNAFGEVHVVIDVNGFYQPSSNVGTPGADGADGADGTNGINGTNGTNGTNGINGTNGTNGAPGLPGADGEPGAVGPQFGYDIVHTSPEISTGLAGASGLDMTIGSDGYPVIAHDDHDGTGMSIVQCNDVTCTDLEPRIEIDFSGDDIGDSAAIVLKPDGKPHIVHRNVSSGATTMTTTCQSASCTASTTGSVGLGVREIDVVVGANGTPRVAGHSVSGPVNDLRVLICLDPSCFSLNASSNSTPASDGFDPSITVLPSGNPVIAHTNDADQLVVSTCTDSVCGGFDNVTVPVAAANPSIAVGTDGNPVIAHNNEAAGDLSVTFCGNSSCSTHTTTTVATADDDGNAPSLAIMPDGLPIIAHTDLDNTDLDITRCTTPDCSGVEQLTVITAGTIDGQIPSITIGSDGNAVVVHRNGTNQSLVVTHVSKSAWSEAARD